MSAMEAWRLLAGDDREVAISHMVFTQSWTLPPAIYVYKGCSTVIESSFIFCISGFNHLEIMEIQLELRIRAIYFLTLNWVGLIVLLSLGTPSLTCCKDTSLPHWQNHSRERNTREREKSSLPGKYSTLFHNNEILSHTEIAFLDSVALKSNWTSCTTTTTQNGFWWNLNSSYPDVPSQYGPFPTILISNYSADKALNG